MLDVSLRKGTTMSDQKKPDPAEQDELSLEELDQAAGGLGIAPIQVKYINEQLNQTGYINEQLSQTGDVGYINEQLK
jgi:hypothetical protein